jgi:hypothetical protein
MYARTGAGLAEQDVPAVLVRLLDPGERVLDAEKFDCAGQAKRLRCSPATSVR